MGFKEKMGARLAAKFPNLSPPELDAMVAQKIRNAQVIAKLSPEEREARRQAREASKSAKSEATEA